MLHGDIVSQSSPVQKIIYAGVVVETATRLVVLQQRDRKPDITNPGAISIFGGTQQGAETVLEIARRELKEELGIDIPDLAFVGYLEVFREAKQTVVGCNIFYAKLTCEVSSLICQEGRIVTFANILDALADGALTDVCKEALIRVSLLRGVGILS